MSQVQQHVGPDEVMQWVTTCVAVGVRETRVEAWMGGWVVVANVTFVRNCHKSALSDLSLKGGRKWHIKMSERN